MVPFQLRYALSRRQRLAVELSPWAPAIAGSLGFGIGVAVLSVHVSLEFLVLLVLPLILYRGLVALLVDVAFRPRQYVELRIDNVTMIVETGAHRQTLPLTGVIQVYRDGEYWTVLHLEGTELNVPTDAISQDQVEYLKSFARHAAAERKAAQAE